MASTSSSNPGLSTSPTQAGASSNASPPAANAPASSLSAALFPHPEESSVRLVFLRVIDSQIVDRSARPVALKSLETLQTVLTNCLRSFTAVESEMGIEEREKVRKLRIRNPGVKKNIADVPGAEEYLLACKFAPQVHLFEPYLIYPSSPSPLALSSLSLGLSVLSARLSALNTSHLLSTSLQLREDEAESQRKTRTLEAVKEDRERVEQRAERERRAREDKARKEQEAEEGRGGRKQAKVWTKPPTQEEAMMKTSEEMRAKRGPQTAGTDYWRKQY